MTAGTPEKMRLKAKARQLGIENFRTMSLDELRSAVEKASKSTQGATRRSGSAKTGTARKATSASKKRASAKTKSASKKRTATRASTKKVAPARKVSSGANKRTSATKTKSAPAKKSTARKTAPKRGAAAQGTAKRRASGRSDVVHRNYVGGKVGKGGYTNIDRVGIDWTRESNVGREGKRKDVLDALRKRNGDYDAVFVDLRSNAVSWYPNALNTYPKSGTKVKAAERQLRWLIGRVALDYAVKTGQHEGRAVKARKTSAAKPRTAPSRKGGSKAAGARVAPRKAASKRKAAPKRAVARKRLSDRATTRKRGVR